jgi:hypothetical protein
MENLDRVGIATNEKKKTNRTADAFRSIYKAKQEVQKAERKAFNMPGVSRFHSDYARTLIEDASNLLSPEHPAQITVGREALPDSRNRALAGVRETLLDRDTISIDASASRLELLADADAVALGVDAAESIQAQNSLEKMLAHQMAAAHKHSLNLIAKIPRAADNLEALRITNASVRLMLAYQDGVRLLQKIRSGGRQVVIVQHVQVSEGGQAVIAGGVQTQCGGAVVGAG